jgi:ABC-type nitrate/sulfonate/bicarbonate transport system substrate-binding protein
MAVGDQEETVGRRTNGAAARLGIVLLGALLAASGARTATAADSTPWRHAVLELKSDAGIVMTPSRGGFAQKQGVALDVLQMKNDSLALRALLAGDLDSYEGGPGSAIVAAAHGADVKIIGCYWTSLEHGLYTRADIASVQDLKGKAIAISSPGALPDMLAHVILEENHVPPTEVRFANLGGDLDRFKALAAGVVQGAIVSVEYVPMAASQGVKLLVHGHDAAPNFIRLCTVTTGKTLARRHDDAVHFMAAEMQGLRYAMSHRDATVKLTREITHAKPDDPRPAYIFDDAAKHGAVDPTMPIPMEKLDWMQNQLVKSGSLPKPIDMSKIVDGSIRAKALEVVGK